MEEEFKNHLEQLNNKRDVHGVYAEKLHKLCDGDFFPCHTLYLAVLDRSLNNLDALDVLLKNGDYGTAMAVLRLQIDNMCRFYGVLRTNDPHDTANIIAHGTPLKKIKDSDGKNLTDRYLVDLLSENSKWLLDVYQLCCGYIHFSEEHLKNTIGKSVPNNQGSRDMYIGTGDDHVPLEHKVNLMLAFGLITDIVFSLYDRWAEISAFYDPLVLKAMYEIA